MNKKVVFLDRDGVINKEKKDYVKNISELEIFPGIENSIKKLKDHGFMVVVITNQSAINRGFVTYEGVKKIHSQIQDYLREHDTTIDNFYICPHRPDEGCFCRKPKPGLILQAADELNIELKSSWMIGDCQKDLKAAENAGCRALLIHENFTLGDAVDKILNSKN